MKLKTLIFFGTNTFDKSDFESIIAACINQDTKAQNVLYKQYFGYSKSICMRYSSNQDEAKEIMNKAFYKVFVNLEKYDS
jgi:RNA polymerase sigma-70 factor (ECF subfamily)